MNIAIDIRPVLDRPLSGVGEYTLHMMSALFSRSRPDDHFILFSTGMRPPQALPGNWPKERYTHRHIRFSNKLLHSSLLAVGKPSLEKLVGEADLFFAPNIAILPKGGSIPMVVTVHDLSFLHYPSLFSLTRRLWHTAVRPRRLFQNAAALLTVSQATADDVASTLDFPREQIFPIVSGATVQERSSATLSEVRNRFHLPDHFLFSLATHEPRKNLVTLLDVFTLLKSQRGYTGDLVLAGARGWSNTDLERAVEAHPYKDAIHMLSYVSDDDKDALYQMADAFLYLSVYEGFGFPPLEALLLGTPVITGHHSSLTEIVGDHAVTVDVHNVRDVAQATHELLRDANARNRLRAQRATLQERYSWDKAADEALAVFRSIVERSKTQ